MLMNQLFSHLSAVPHLVPVLNNLWNAFEAAFNGYLYQDAVLITVVVESRRFALYGLVTVIAI